MKKKIAIVLGTRPEAIKLIPIYLRIKKESTYDIILINTGQHKEMLDQVFEFFGVNPDYNLSVMRNEQSLSTISSALIISLNDIYDNVNPDLIIVQGDTASCFFAGLLGYYKRKKIVHLEAGLRTGNKNSPFPEEGFRHMLSSIVDLHFAPTQESKMNLKRENIKESKIEVVGNTVIDSLLLAKNIIDKQREFYENKFSSVLNKNNKNILITTHRRENQGVGLDNICLALKFLSAQYSDFNFIYPVHLSPYVQTVVKNSLKEITNIKLLDPLPYDDLIYIMGESYLVLTDSGGIQEEAPSLNKPVLILRDSTERPEGVLAGCSIVIGTNVDSIVSTFQKLVEDKKKYSEMASSINPFGDGKSSERVVNEIFKMT